MCPDVVWTCYRARMSSDRTDATKAPLTPAEELAAVKEELRRAHQDLERFAYFLGHDFRAPLRHVAAFSGLLAKELHAHDNKEVATWLGFMNGGAKLIQDLVDEVLLFSRARRATAVVGETALGALFESIQASAPFSDGLSLKNEVGADVVVAISAPHATQVFEHLFRNAIQFRKTGEAAQLSLTSRRTPHEDAWEIEIRDEGRGIREDALEHVFDAFYRSSDSPRESPGLGLTVAQHLVGLYGGSIAIESEHGVFTLVRVFLPTSRR